MTLGPLLLAQGHPVTVEYRTARLTILVDPRKKALFERLCAEEDATPSQVVRRLIRRYIEERTGQPWVPRGDSGKRAARSAARGDTSAPGARSSGRRRA
jgi:ribbon-helix-helix protein